MKKVHTLLPLLAIVLVSACSPKIYFTEETKDQLERNEVALNNVQYYNSETIVLVRQIKKEEVNVVSGKVKMEQGRYIEEIVIKSHTPGVFTESNGKVLFISFEDGDNKVIPFVKIKSRSGDNPPIYQVGSLEWTNKNGKKVGVINYGDNKYSIVSGDKSRLLISKDVLYKREVKSHVAKGRKIN